MGLLDTIAGLFGKKSEGPAQPGAANGEKKKLVKQVYEGRPREKPEWAENLDQAHLVNACEKHAVCKYTPHIEIKKIMSARKGVDGNLEPEYEGVAADCGAIKNFGRHVAQRDGFLQPYRYVDINHIFTCCCDKPRKCTFYSLAEGQDQDLNKRMKRVGG